MTYTVEQLSPDRARLRGVMRLESATAYEIAFAPVRAAMLATPGTYTIELAELTLMNSLGIRALGMLVLAAAEAGTVLVLRGSTQVPWQVKTVWSLRALHPQLSIQLA
jgi:hypothetical protein